VIVREKSDNPIEAVEIRTDDIPETLDIEVLNEEPKDENMASVTEVGQNKKTDETDVKEELKLSGEEKEEFVNKPSKQSENKSQHSLYFFFQYS